TGSRKPWGPLLPTERPDSRDVALRTNPGPTRTPPHRATGGTPTERKQAPSRVPSHRCTTVIASFEKELCGVLPCRDPQEPPTEPPGSSGSYLKALDPTVLCAGRGTSYRRS